MGAQLRPQANASASVRKISWKGGIFMIFEICVDSVEGALAAQGGGAQRIELCDNLVEGGTTPSIGMIRTVRHVITIGLNVIIRPRGGDFCYTPLEFEVMRQDILAVKELGVNGVVIGLLLPDGSVDIERTRELVELARPLSVTFHRAIDMCRDPYEALEALVELGIDRILTSGQKATFSEGVDCIAGLVRKAGDRIIILAGGGINIKNAARLAAQTGVQEMHFAALKTVPSKMLYHQTGVRMGRYYRPDEYVLNITDLDKIKRVIAQITKDVKP